MKSKRKLQKLLSLLLIFALVFTLGACGGTTTPPPPPPPADDPEEDVIDLNDPKQGEKLVIVFGTEGLPTAPQTQASMWAMARIEEETGGRITFEQHLAGALGTGAQGLSQVMDGTIHLSEVSVGLFSQYVDTVQVAQLPFLLGSYEKEYKAFNSPEWQALLDSLEEIGVKALSMNECGIREFAHVSKPINTVADIKGQKIRIVPSNMLQNAMEKLGANPVPIAYGEVYTALQNKVIDALEINLMSMDTMNFYEVVKYMSFIGMYPFPTILVLNLDYYNSLTPQDQALITKWFKEGTKHCFNVTLPAIEKTALENLLAAGVVTNDIEDPTPFKELMKPVYDEYAALDPRIKAFIEMAEKL